MNDLLSEIRSCRICADQLKHTPRPVLQAGERARLLIIGQAPGRKVHESGIPWKDKSGERLRNWLGLKEDQFYDENLVALIPMGFCFPGTAKGGDLPPMKICAPTWHEPLLSQLSEVKLTLLIGQYAQRYYLGSQCRDSLTETVANWREYFPRYLPIPHPSPRNGIWLRKNPWFEKEVIPKIQGIVEEYL